MIECGFSQIELRSWFKIGGFRVQRLKAEMKDPTFRSRKLEPRTPSHAFNEEDFARLKAHVASWNSRLEDGYPCFHRRQKRYFIVKPDQEKVTWEKLHHEYKVKMEQGKHRVMSYSRWLQYVHYFFPEISIAPPKEDICDGCYAIDTELSNPNLTEERHEFLINLKKTHVQEAITQRRAMQALIKQYVQKLAPDQPLPDLMLPDYIIDIFMTKGVKTKELMRFAL